MANTTTTLDATIESKSNIDKDAVTLLHVNFDTTTTTAFEIIAGIAGKQIFIRRVILWSKSGSNVLKFEQNGEEILFITATVDQAIMYDFNELPIMFDSGEGVDIQAVTGLLDMELLVWYFTRND